MDSSPSTVKYYLTIFNFNNWYIKYILPKTRHLNSIENLDKLSDSNEGSFFTSYPLPINENLKSIKVMKFKKIIN